MITYGSGEANTTARIVSVCRDFLTGHLYELALLIRPCLLTELDYLAVHPDHHRKGIATMLVASGAKVAADLGLDIVAIAMGKSAHDLCLKLGFEQLEHESQDLSTYGEEGVYDTYYLLKRATKEVKASDSES